MPYVEGTDMENCSRLLMFIWSFSVLDHKQLPIDIIIDQSSLVHVCELL